VSFELLSQKQCPPDFHGRAKRIHRPAQCVGTVKMKQTASCRAFAWYGSWQTRQPRRRRRVLLVVCLTQKPGVSFSNINLARTEFGIEGD
jgi:hypothetical protein